MKPYIIEIYALDHEDHLYVYSRSYCDDLQECFLNYRITCQNFSFSIIRLVGYHIYKSLESKYPSNFVCFENDLI